jgi:hypothetical protein
VGSVQGDINHTLAYDRVTDTDCLWQLRPEIHFTAHKHPTAQTRLLNPSHQHPTHSGRN